MNRKCFLAYKIIIFINNVSCLFLKKTTKIEGAQYTNLRIRLRMNKNYLHAGYLEINKGPHGSRKSQLTRTLVYWVESITVIFHPPEQNKAMLSGMCGQSDKVYKRPSLLCGNSSRK